MQDYNSKQNYDSQSTDLSIGDIASALWCARAWALGGVLVALAAASTLLILNNFSRIVTRTYSQEIAFMIGGQSAAQYPDDTQFSPNDLRSPVVLNRVYEEAQLEKFGLSYQEFVTSISVTPSSAIYEGVVGRYALLTLA